MIVRPCSQAIVALTFSKYASKPFFPGEPFSGIISEHDWSISSPECEPPDEAAKLLALFIIIGTGIIQLGRGQDLSLFEFLQPLVVAGKVSIFTWDDTVCLQRLELPQLCDRGAPGPGEEPAPCHRHLHHPGHGGLHPHQHRLLHHAQRPGGPGLWGRRRGIVKFMNDDKSEQNITLLMSRHLLSDCTGRLHFSFLSLLRCPLSEVGI